MSLRLGQCLPLLPSPSSVSQNWGHSHLKAYSLRSQVVDAGSHLGLSAGAMIRIAARASSSGLLGLLVWVSRASIQRGKEGGTKKEGSQSSGYVVLWPTSEFIQYHSYHILFIRTVSLSLAHIQREGNLTLPWWEKCQRFGGHILSHPAWLRLLLKNSDSMYLWWAPRICF